MLANFLAIVVGLGSLGFYLAAFILPEVHRRSDFFWSGVGMFYAVVLWYCARQMQGAVLLGQTASVGLLLWLGYQTLLLRRETTPAAQKTPIQLGKTERSRSAIRPIAKDYEFVEDGVEDAIEPMAASADSPILIQPAADSFAPQIVVPAAMPKPGPEEITSAAALVTGVEEESSPSKKIVQKTVKNREIPNPLAAVGIVVDWVKDVVIPKKKAPLPMIELPPRPPSIPKPGNTAEISEQPEATAPADDAPAHSVQETTAHPEPLVDSPQGTESISSIASSTVEQQAKDEESNWPDDEFWN